MNVYKDGSQTDVSEVYKKLFTNSKVSTKFFLLIYIYVYLNIFFSILSFF